MNFDEEVIVRLLTFDNWFLFNNVNKPYSKIFMHLNKLLKRAEGRSCLIFLNNMEKFYKKSLNTCNLSKKVQFFSSF